MNDRIRSRDFFYNKYMLILFYFARFYNKRFISISKKSVQIISNVEYYFFDLAILN